MNEVSTTSMPAMTSATINGNGLASAQPAAAAKAATARNARRTPRISPRMSVSPAAHRHEAPAEEHDTHGHGPADERGPHDGGWMDDGFEERRREAERRADDDREQAGTQRKRGTDARGHVRGTSETSPSTIRHARTLSAPVAGSASSSLSETSTYSASG